MHYKFSTAIIVATLLLTACGASIREKTIQITYQSLHAAKDGFLAYTKSRGEHIVDEATSEAEGKAKLDAFLAKADKVSLALQAAFVTLALATLDLNVDAVADAIKSAKEVHRLYKELEAL